MPTIYRIRSTIVTLFISVMSLTPIASNAQIFDLEEPKFSVEKKDGKFELRLYQKMIVAEISVEGDVTDAGDIGTQILKDYIFREGLNKPEDSSKNESISMTLPVTMEKIDTPIAMTLPVTMEQSSSSTYRMHFVMPAQYSLETLPVPNDKRISLREIDEQRVAAIRFSKFSTETNISEQTKLLKDWMKVNGLMEIGAPQFARYDPPFIPPLLRRSEILIQTE